MTSLYFFWKGSGNTRNRCIFFGCGGGFEPPTAGCRAGRRFILFQDVLRKGFVHFLMTAPWLPPVREAAVSNRRIRAHRIALPTPSNAVSMRLECVLYIGHHAD